jgi:hypothetical protein
MKLPNVERAEVSLEKLEAYLLNEAHPDNGGKARLFTRLGFTRERPEGLSKSLLLLAKNSEVTKRMDSPHGIKYIVDGLIVGNRGAARIRSIWICDAEDPNTPRLVTAYPL